MAVLGCRDGGLVGRECCPPVNGVWTILDALETGIEVISGTLVPDVVVSDTTIPDATPGPIVVHGAAVTGGANLLTIIAHTATEDEVGHLIIREGPVGFAQATTQRLSVGSALTVYTHRLVGVELAIDLDNDMSGDIVMHVLAMLRTVA